MYKQVHAKSTRHGGGAHRGTEDECAVIDITLIDLSKLFQTKFLS